MFKILLVKKKIFGLLTLAMGVTTAVVIYSLNNSSESSSDLVWNKSEFRNEAKQGTLIGVESFAHGTPAEGIPLRERPKPKD